MAISFDSSFENGGGVVFGTYGIQYDPSEFERTRDDGFTAIGMVPDCRVFIYGTEVTKDIKDVNVSNSSVDGNKCDITLFSPRGRYEISKQDLMGKWREDKDILAAYDYDFLKRQTPSETDAFLDQISPNVFGKKTASNIKNVFQASQNLSNITVLGGYNYGVPKVKGTTRQIFETKYFSGIYKQTGDIVFDYRDPVQVFFKGRFAPFWYFGFSGIIVGWDDTDAYQQPQSIKLKCEDVTALWKRSKTVEQGSMFPFSRGESRFKEVNSKAAYVLTDTIAASFSFSDLIKLVAFGFDYGAFAYNCHVSNPGRYNVTSSDNTTTVAVNVSDPATYKDLRKKQRDEGLIDSAFTIGVGADDGKYMFTQAPWGAGVSFSGEAAGFSGQTGSLQAGSSSVEGKGGLSGYDKVNAEYGSYSKRGSVGIVNIGDIHYIFSDPKLGLGYSYELNNAPLSPAISLYVQFNEIDFPKSTPFTGSNLKKYLDLSVRYWETDHRIPLTKFDSTQPGTGWQDGKAFGIAGAHPAMTYQFLNNFNMLENIWSQCYKVTKDVRDSLVMTPNDKIRAIVGGEPTEMVPYDEKYREPAGTEFNLFRPRLFLVMPQRFSDRYKKASDGKFAQFENLFKQQATTTYEFFVTKLKGLEYIMYASPAGDIFMEPELYDFHPLDFSPKIEPRQIYTKTLGVKFRTQSGITNQAATRTDSAYFYNFKANHPFFITEKDRIRVSQTFDHKLIFTDITVKGGQTPAGGVLEIMNDQMLAMFTDLNMSGSSKGIRANNMLTNGRYIADGFQNLFKMDAPAATIVTQITENTKLLNKLTLEHLNNNNGTVTLSTLLNKYITYLRDDLKSSDPLFIYFQNQQAKLLQQLKSSLLSDVTDQSIINEGIFSALFPTLSNTSGVGLTSTRVMDIISIETSVPKTPSQQDAKKTKQQNTPAPDFFNRSSYNQAVDILQDSVPNSTNPSTKGLFELLQLGLPFVQDDGPANESEKRINAVLADIAKLMDQNLKYATITAFTIADEKRLTRDGIYDPRLDMVKFYGYNPSREPIKNPFIKNGDEANQYALTVFNRLKGKAFKLQIDLIGRPEFCLNRPYYCERKDSIGLLTNFSIRYQYGSSFSSSATLEYVRKNAIVYNYSRDTLDAIPDDSGNNNNFFKYQADTYYKANDLLSKLQSKAVSSLTSLTTGSNPGTGRAVAAGVVGGVASRLTSSLLPVGGVFVAHDRIGHIPFDTRFGDDTVAATATTPKFTGTENQSQSAQALVYYANLITNKLIEFNKVDEQAAKLNTELTNENKKLTELNKNLSDITNDMISSSLTSTTTKKTYKSLGMKRHALFTNWNNAKKQVNDQKSSINSKQNSQNTLRQAYFTLIKQLWGIQKDDPNLIPLIAKPEKYQAYIDLELGSSTELPISVENSYFYQIYFGAKWAWGATAKQLSLIFDVSHAKANNQQSLLGQAVPFYVKLSK